MKLLRAILVSLALLGPVVVDRPAEASQIRSTVCNWVARNSGSYQGADAYCPHRWEYGGPQYFRIRLECHNNWGGTSVRYGIWRYGGNWSASTALCSNPSYPIRTIGGTYIQFSG